LVKYGTVNVNKVVIKILQGSVVTQTELGGLTVYPVTYLVHSLSAHIIKIG